MVRLFQWQIFSIHMRVFCRKISEVCHLGSNMRVSQFRKSHQHLFRWRFRAPQKTTRNFSHTQFFQRIFLKKDHEKSIQNYLLASQSQQGVQSLTTQEMHKASFLMLVIVVKHGSSTTKLKIYHQNNLKKILELLTLQLDEILYFQGIIPVHWWQMTI